MKQREYHIGPGAVSLLLIIVVVSMSVLGLLSLISARGDYKLTERAKNFAVAERTASAEAENRLAELDSLLAKSSKRCYNESDYVTDVQNNLPEGMTMHENRVSWEITASSGRVLKCEVEVLPFGSSPRFAWTVHTFDAAEHEDYSRMNFDAWE